MRLLFAIILIACNSAAGFGQTAEFSIKKSVHKFPKTKAGVILEHTFEFENTGKEPLIFSGFKVACECTKAYLPEKPILPGQKGSIRVTFDTKGKSYFQDRVIILNTNTKKKEEQLRIKVMIEPNQ